MQTHRAQPIVNSMRYLVPVLFDLGNALKGRQAAPFELYDAARKSQRRKGNVMADTASIADLKASLRGQLIEPKDAAYEEARALYNGMIDKRPLAIARCADVADVIAAVNFGRDSGLPIAIRGGGHNGPGLGSVDKGLMIDLLQMKGVRVDPAARTSSRRRRRPVSCH
jgi:FAD binding domain